MEWFRRLYTARGLLGKTPALGELPTTRELYGHSLEVATPAIADTVLVALISRVDTVMVSVLGAAAIAAVGLTSQPRMIIMATFMALSTGLTAVVARRRGQEDKEGAGRVLSQALALCAGLSTLAVVAGAVFARPLLSFAGAQADSIDMATTYFQILMAGIPFSVITICINGAQRGCGHTKISMKINLVANLTNMFFNYLLIGGNFGFPAMGVAGAALATDIGNTVGMAMAFYSLRSSNESFLTISWRQLLRPERATLAPVLSVGLSAGIEQIFLRVGFFFYTKIIASLGTDVMATHNICNSILNVAFAFCDGMAMSAAALFGQSLGRGRPDVAVLYCKACQRLSMVISAGLMVAFTTCGRYMIYPFSREEAIIALGIPVLWIVAITAPFQSTQFVTSSCLRSAGDTKYTAWVSMVSVGILRPVAAWVLCYPLGGGLVGAWVSYFLDQMLRMTLCVIRFKHGGWKKIKL